MHKATLIAGVIYLVLGIAFVLEALDYWSFRLVDLRVIAPLALVAIGVAVVIRALTQKSR